VATNTTIRGTATGAPAPFEDSGLFLVAVVVAKQDRDELLRWFVVSAVSGDVGSGDTVGSGGDSDLELLTVLPVSPLLCPFGAPFARLLPL
jgi:hypothetical protein